VRNISYAAVPVNTRLVVEGVLTGIGSVFIPTLANSSSGPESVAKLQMCFDPRKIHDQFYVEDLFDLQDEESQQIGAADIDAFIAILEGGDDRSTLEAIESLVINLPPAALKVFRHISKVLKQLAPYMLQIIKHAYDCGMLDIVLGMLMTFVLGLFPFLIFIVIPLAVALFAYDVYTQIKTLIESWNRDWFKFGKAAGVLTGYIGSMVIAYKISKTKAEKASFQCNTGASTSTGKCGVILPDNENKYWSNTGEFRGNKVTL
jgi:hypothetical protein